MGNEHTVCQMFSVGLSSGHFGGSGTSVLRRIGLAHTQFAEATCGTIRLKLFKIGALVTTSVRRIKIAMASSCPYTQEWRLAAARLWLARGSPA